MTFKKIAVIFTSDLFTYRHVPPDSNVNMNSQHKYSFQPVGRCWGRGAQCSASQTEICGGKTECLLNSAHNSLRGRSAGERRTSRLQSCCEGLKIKSIQICLKHSEYLGAVEVAGEKSLSCNHANEKHVFFSVFQHSSRVQHKDDQPGASCRLLSWSRAKDSGSSQGMTKRDPSRSASWSEARSWSRSASGRLSNTLRWKRRCTSIHDTASVVGGAQFRLLEERQQWDLRLTSDHLSSDETAAAWPRSSPMARCAAGLESRSVATLGRGASWTSPPAADWNQGRPKGSKDNVSVMSIHTFYDVMSIHTAHLFSIRYWR